MRFFLLVKNGFMRLLAFLGWAGALGAGVAVLVVGGIHAALAVRQEAQLKKVQFVQFEIAKLDKEISEISKLKDMIAALLARKRVVDALSIDRVGPSRLLDLLARQRPDGIYLTRVDQAGSQIELIGYAASYSDVASFIRSVDSQPHFKYAALAEIKTESAPKVSGYPIWFKVNAQSTYRSSRTGGSIGAGARTGNPGDPK